MTTETLIILLTFVLAMATYLLPSYFKFINSGLTEMAGSRDNVTVGDNVLGQRAERASANFKETLPWAIGLLILVQVTGDANGATALGGWLYLIARALYVPSYLSGIPYLRSLTWAAAMLGLGLITLQLL